MYWASAHRKECNFRVVLIVYKIFAKNLEKAVDKCGPTLYTNKVGCASNSDEMES